MCAALIVLVGEAGAEDRFSGHLDDVLRALALTRSDLAIAKDYLPDPDRLSVVRARMRDPVSADRWVRAFSRDVGSARHGAALETVGALLDGQPAGERSPGEEDIEALVTEIGNEIGKTTSPGSLIDLIHPARSLRPGEAAARIHHGRTARIGSLVDVGVRLLEAIGSTEIPEDGPRTYETAYGRIAVGSTGRDTYEGGYALILEPGGDDVYRSAAGVASETVPVSVVIDWSGNDRYEGDAAVGRNGVGILIDRSGDDVYTGGDVSLGAAAAGVGVLIDETGDDRYTSAVGGQGFALYGVGLLIDLKGTDVYTVDLLGQGCAGPGGVGMLIDRNGDDTYRAGGPHKDFREAGRYAKSMSQGFSTGLDTEASGGVGMLIDLRGRDRYEVAYFGQGTAHWAGMGVLYDGAGDDSYVARRYAQGCGVHLSTGILVDDSGDDVYSMWGVGQGCGHDLAVGVLSDRTGNDTYKLNWLGQGAAAGNGTGLLMDRAGDDTYSAVNPDTQGHGAVARDYGSIGVLLDGGGEDQFRVDGGKRLVISGTHGARYDAAAP